ncbi:hypothetical protein Tco_0746060 [Tanacetum coccineum]
MTRIESLEKDLKQTKHTMRNEIVKLVKKVKKMEKVVKSRRVVLTDSEDEAAENSSKQGRNLQKDESEVFETPKQGKSSGETDISPQGLEAAETLAEALSQIKTKRRNVKTRVRRRLDAEDVSTGFEDVSTGFEDVSTGFTDIKSASEKVSSGGEHVSASQREGKAVLEETPQTKRTKKQIREEQASLAEIARIQAEETKLSLRKCEDRKNCYAKDMSEEDFAKRMVDLVNQRKKYFAEEIEKAKRTTKAELKSIEPVKKKGKRRKQIARKGLHTAKDEAEKDEASEEDDSSSSINVPINPIPVQYLNLDSTDIYMLAERKYPLSANVCQTILKMKLLDGKMNEDCYKLLKMMEKQAGVRK